MTVIAEYENGGVCGGGGVILYGSNFMVAPELGKLTKYGHFTHIWPYRKIQTIHDRKINLGSTPPFSYSAITVVQTERLYLLRFKKYGIQAYMGEFPYGKLVNFSEVTRR